MKTLQRNFFKKPLIQFLYFEGYPNTTATLDNLRLAISNHPLIYFKL